MVRSYRKYRLSQSIIILHNKLPLDVLNIIFSYCILKSRMIADDASCLSEFVFFTNDYLLNLGHKNSSKLCGYVLVKNRFFFVLARTQRYEQWPESLGQCQREINNKRVNCALGPKRASSFLHKFVSTVDVHCLFFLSRELSKSLQGIDPGIYIPLCRIL